MVLQFIDDKRRRENEELETRRIFFFFRGLGFHIFTRFICFSHLRGDLGERGG